MHVTNIQLNWDFLGKGPRESNTAWERFLSRHMNDQFKRNEPINFLSSLVTDSRSRQIYISQVGVNGGDVFSHTFFQKLLTPLLEHGECTLEQMTLNIHKSYEALKNTQVFKNISVNVHSDFSSILPKQDSPRNYGSENPLLAKIIFDLMPCNLSVIEGLSNLNSEDHLNVNLNYLNRNFNGNAESVNFAVDYNPYKPNDRFSTYARIAFPLKCPSSSVLVKLHHGQQNNQTWQSASEATTGGSIGLQHTLSQRSLESYTGLSVLKRNLHDVEDNAPQQVKNTDSDTLQTCLVAKTTYLSPSPSILSGFKATIESQISSVQEQKEVNPPAFFKGSIATEAWNSFFGDFITVRAAASAGVIYLQSKDTVHVSEKFYLGGLHSFRGFEKNALNAEGGNLYYKFGGTVYGNIPRFILNNQLPLRWYVDGTIGSLSVATLGAASIGVGVKYFNEWANFEAGYYAARRLNDASTAGIKNGLMFAVAIGGSNRD